MNTENIVIGVLLLVIIGAIAYLAMNQGDTVVTVEPTTEEVPITPTESDDGIGDGAEPLPVVTERGSETVIGESVNGTDIIAYHFGDGEREVLLIGGTHGGYSPNTTALAKEAIEFFNDNEVDIPAGVTLTIIPTLNPDGLTKTGAAGRFNANEVDLNRNFDCDWSATAVWRDREVSGGSAAFSEPEAAALRDYVETNDPQAAIVLFSAEGKVYPSACDTTPSKASIQLAANYATAAGYPAEAEFDAYAITGDMVNWLAKQSIPAISVLLSNHENTEWTKNKAGIMAVLESYEE